MKRLKKAFCLLLCAALLCTVLSLGASALPTDDPCPHVYIHGLMGSVLLKDKTDPSSEPIWPPDAGAILDEVKPMLPDLLKLVARHDLKTFAERAVDVVLPYFEPVFLSGDGTAQNGSGPFFAYPPANSISKDSTVTFSYDWRLDPVDVAADLNDFIDYVLESSGAAKVNISAHSLGGVVLLSYLSIYGTEKVRGVCFDASAMYGESYTGDLLRGDIVFDPDSIEYYLRYALEGNEYETLLNELIEAANNIGLLDLLTLWANDLVKQGRETVFMRLLGPLFVNWPCIWAMCPDEDIDEGMSFVFDTLYKDEDKTALRERIENFNTLVRAKKNQTLKAVDENCNLYVLTRYGYSSIPVTPSYLELSDSVVDTKYASIGATTAQYGKKLPADYRKNVDPAFLSPDETVDASTCMFPQQTWFIRALPHSTQPSSRDALIERLLREDTQITVDTYEDLPRFLMYDRTNETIVPDEGPQTLSFFAKLRAFFSELGALIASVFNR